MPSGAEPSKFSGQDPEADTNNEQKEVQSSQAKIPLTLEQIRTQAIDGVRNAGPMSDGDKNYSQCPQCHCENIQKLSLIHDAGTINSQSNTIGGMIGSVHSHGKNGTLTAGSVSSTSGTTQSQIAQRYAPPQKPSGSSAMGCLAISCCMAAIVGMYLAFVAGNGNITESQSGIFGLILMLVSLVAGFLVYQKIKTEDVILSRQHALVSNEYDRAFLCHRCGYLFAMRNGKAAPCKFYTPIR